MSKLINKTALGQYSNSFWEKIKDYTNETLKNVELIDESDGTKSLKFTTKDDTELTISLKEFAQLDKENEFTAINSFKDVLITEAMQVKNTSLGTDGQGYDASTVATGTKLLHSGLFGNKYVDKLIYIIPSAFTNSEITDVNIWSVDKSNDTIEEQLKTNETLTVNTTSDGVKYIEIPINTAFDKDVYFLIKTGSTAQLQDVAQIDTSKQDYVISTTQNTLDAGTVVTGTADVTVKMYIVGRLSLKDLMEKVHSLTSDMNDVVQTVEIYGDAENERKLVVSKKNGTTDEILLNDFAQLDKENEFTQKNSFRNDIEVDLTQSFNNDHLGDYTASGNRFYSHQLYSGTKTLTSGLFANGYVEKIIYYAESDATDPFTGIDVWSVDASNNTVLELVVENAAIPITTFGETTTRVIEVPIQKTFDTNVYFIMKTRVSNRLRSVVVNSRDSNDYVNILSSETISIGNELPANQSMYWTSRMIIVGGRTSITDIVNTIDTIESGFVKQEEVTTTSEANKIVRLDATGKIDSNMLPSIAINDFISVDTFDQATLIDEMYQNGDVIYVTSTQERYLCIDKSKTTFAERFIKLVDKDGTVSAINGESGVVTLALESTETHLKLKVNNIEATSLEIITEDEIVQMLNALQ